MNSEIKEIFKDGIIINNENIPVAHLRYKGKSKKYVIWTIIDDSPALSADDEPIYGITQVDIDIYSSGNYKTIMAEIKNRMKNNGWLWIGDSPEMFDNDTQFYHRTCTFEKEREI